MTDFEAAPRWCPGINDLTEAHWTTWDNFYWIRRKCADGTFSRRIDTYCKDCSKKRIKKWRQENRDKVSKYNKTWYRNDLEEHRRIYRERGRLARGIHAWTWKKYRVEYKVERLPIQPFRDWLKGNIVPLLATKEDIRQAMGETTRRDHDAMVGLITWTSIARSINVDPKTLPNYTSGKSKTVPREIVDRVGLLFGHMDLSDELYEERLEESA